MSHSQRDRARRIDGAGSGAALGRTPLGFAAAIMTMKDGRRQDQHPAILLLCPWPSCRMFPPPCDLVAEKICDACVLRKVRPRFRRGVLPLPEHVLRAIGTIQEF
jgi:hypothetical protein